MSSENQVAKTRPDLGQKVVHNMLAQVNDFAVVESGELTPQEKGFAMETILNIERQLQLRGITWQDIDIKGCMLPQQIKSNARLGLSFAENELYLDIRNNSKTGKKDINIFKQYQGVEKELTKWCSKKILRYKKGVVLKGEELVIQTDFETGLDKIVGIKNSRPSTESRNNWDTIDSAYIIAYVEEGNKVVQYFAIADRDRLERAYDASPSKDKAVWKLDTKLMCLKTASWVLYNNVLKPFVQVPVELMQDWERTNTNMDFDKTTVLEEVEVINEEDANKKELTFSEEPVVVEKPATHHNPITGEVIEGDGVTEEDDDEKPF